MTTRADQGSSAPRGRANESGGAPAEDGPATSKVNRTEPSCDQCRSMKTKCIDKQDPPCKRCREARIACTFTAAPLKGSSRRRIIVLEDEMAEMKSTLSKIAQHLGIQGQGEPRFLPVGEQTRSLHFTPKSLEQWVGSNNPDMTRPSGRSGNGDPDGTQMYTDGQAGDNTAGSTSEADDDSGEQDEVDFLSTATTAAPMVAIQSLDERARLRRVPESRRRKHRESDHGPSPTGIKRRRITPKEFDPISEGVCSVTDARRWFDGFFTRSHRHLPLFDVTIDTFESLRERSPFILSVILMIGQRADNGIGDPALQEELLALAERNASTTLFSPRVNMETVQAMLLLACWGDMMWRPGAHALSMAIDLGLHRCLPTLVESGMGADKSPAGLELDRGLVTGARVFFAVCKTAVEMCLNYGRPLIFPFEDTIRLGRQLLSHPLSTIDDTRCILCLEVSSLRFPLHQPMSAAFIDISTGMIARSRLELEMLDSHWRTYYRERAVSAGDLLWEEMETVELYAKLEINATVLYGIRGQQDIATMSSQRRGWLETALQAAHALVTRVTSGSQMSSLPYANRYAHLGLVMAARYLVRFACLLPQVINSKQVAKDVEQLAETMSRVPGFRLASYLKTTVQRARDRFQLPPSSVRASPTLQHLALPGVSNPMPFDQMTAPFLPTSAGINQPIPIDTSPNWDLGIAEELFSNMQWADPRNGMTFDSNIWFPYPPLG